MVSLFFVCAYMCLHLYVGAHVHTFVWRPEVKAKDPPPPSHSLP